MKIERFKKIGKVNSPPDQDLDKVDKICIRNLCTHEHFYNPNKEPVSILPERGLFSPFIDQEFEDFYNNPP